MSREKSLITFSKSIKGNLSQYSAHHQFSTQNTTDTEMLTDRDAEEEKSRERTWSTSWTDRHGHATIKQVITTTHSQQRRHCGLSIARLSTSNTVSSQNSIGTLNSTWRSISPRMTTGFIHCHVHNTHLFLSIVNQYWLNASSQANI